jgi:hypothetical protein
MGRSQRHMILEQNAPANGEAIAEGQPAPGFILQAHEAPVVEYESGGPLAGSTTVDVSNIQVTYGAAGGPLAGSSTSSAVPEGGVGPGPEPGPPDEELRIVGFNPESIPAGYPDMTVVCFGQGFIGGAVVVFGGEVMETEFLSDNQLRFLCPSAGASVGPVPVIVRQGADETEPVDFNFTEEPAEGRTQKRRKKAE